MEEIPPSEKSREPEKESGWEEQELNPVGPEFWIGQILMVGGVVVGIWLAGRSGFAEAMRFSKQENARQARSALRALRLELELNLHEVRIARDRVREKKRVNVPIRTPYLDSASSRPYMTLVDPRLVPEILKLLRYPLQKALQAVEGTGPVEKVDLDRVLEILDEVLDQAGPRVLSMLREEERKLDEALARLGVKP